MSIINYPFQAETPLFPQPQPLLPLRIINPHSRLDMRTWGLIDTGAKTTHIPRSIAESLKHECEKGTLVKVPTAGGEVKAYLHTFAIHILGMDMDGIVNESNVEAVIAEQPIAVSDLCSIVLLGVKEFLAHYILEIDYPKQVFSLRRPTERPK
jgi:predicted aspartyl protease